MRRSFVTLSRRSGLPFSGHRTAAVFKRYNIVEEQDLKAAVHVLNRARASTPPGAAGAGLRSARTGDGATAPAMPGGDGHDSDTFDRKWPEARSPRQ